jgi:phosphosulfolactate phosphohydrolase-like enzyme
MRIDICWPWELDRDIPHTVVVCDVFAATTNITSFLSRGVNRLYITNMENINDVRQHNPKALLIGESNDLPKNYFDVSNEPADACRADVYGRDVIYMSNNGTKVMETAFQKKATSVIAAAFTNIETVGTWIRERNVSDITLIPAGECVFSDPHTIEDLVCCITLRDIVKGKTLQWEPIVRRVRRYILTHYNPYTLKLNDDLEIVLERNRYPSVPVCFWQKYGLISIENACEKL